MIPVFLDSARKHKNLVRTYKNWLPDEDFLVHSIAWDLGVLAPTGLAAPGVPTRLGPTPVDII
jgi:hypothetical protein